MNSFGDGLKVYDLSRQDYKDMEKTEFVRSSWRDIWAVGEN